MNLLAERIFDYLLISSMTATILCLFALLIIKIGKIRSSIYQHMIWLIVLIGAVVFSTIWQYGPKINLAILSVKGEPESVFKSLTDSYNIEHDVLKSSYAVSQAPSSTIILDNSNKPQFLSIKFVIAGIWLLGVIFMFTRLIVSAYKLRRICLASTLIEGEKLAIGKRNIKLLLCSEVGSPACFGIFQPKIILPVKIYNTSSQEDIQMVLSHELAHIRRGDCWVNLLQQVFKAIFFFHPLVWYASFQLTQQREKICDNTVLSSGVSLTGYARLLMQIVEHGFERDCFQAVALYEGRLLLRIQSILNPECDRKTKTPFRAVIAGIVALLVCLLSSTLRLEAKTQINGSVKTKNSSYGISSDYCVNSTREVIDGELSAYAEKDAFTLKDGETAKMKLEENFFGVTEIYITPNIKTEGTEFNLIISDNKEMPLRILDIGIIHDGDSRVFGGKIINGKDDIFCSIKISPQRKADNFVFVESEVLLSFIPTNKEIEEELLKQGKKGQFRLQAGKISLLIMQYKRQNGYYPETLRHLNTTLPKDVYSSSSQDYAYEYSRSKFILSSCGKDGIYGNADDEFSIFYNGGACSGQRHELYPLEEDIEGETQTEKVLGDRPHGNCSISGKVVSEANGEPIGYARVHLYYHLTQSSIFVNVLSDGSFEFKDIPVGPFTLASSHVPGYQDFKYDPESKDSQYPIFSLQSGEQREDIVLEIKPSFRISGKVYDENGSLPTDMDGLMVKAWSKIKNSDGYESNGKHALVNKTDGSWSIDGLDGRPVCIMALNWNAAKQGNAYPPIYYPSTFSRSNSKVIKFDGQSDIKCIDLQLQKTGGLVLEGVVCDDSGRPVPEAFVVVHRRDMLFDFITDYTDEQGRYQIYGLGDGEFLVHVDAVHRGLVRTRSPINIDNTNSKSQLDFKLKRGVSISGRIVNVDGSDWQVSRRSCGYAAIKEQSSMNSSFSLTNFRNKYRPANFVKSYAGLFYRGKGDYTDAQMIFKTENTFVIQGVMPGQTLINFRPMKDGQIVEKIMHKGINIMETGIDTKLNQEIYDITIIVGGP